MGCAARGAGLAIVANLADDAGTSSTMYNTDVVLDSDGALVAAYRKLNLWGEANMATPSECERVTFSPVALAGRTFGLVTCADLIYAEPTLARRNCCTERGVFASVCARAASCESAASRCRCSR